VRLESLSELLHSLLKLLVSQGLRSQILVRAHISILHNARFNNGLILKAFFSLPSGLLRGKSWGQALTRLVLLRWLLLLFFTCTNHNATTGTPFVIAINRILLLVFLFFLRFLRCFLDLTSPVRTIVRLIDVVDQIIDVFLINLLIPCIFLLILPDICILVFRLSLLPFIVDTQTAH